MRTINDCPIPDGPSTPPDPEDFACDICGERDGHTCTLREYGIAGFDIQDLRDAARQKDVLEISDWLDGTTWVPLPSGFMGFGDESSTARKARVKKLLAFVRDVLDHVEEWSK